MGAPESEDSADADQGEMAGDAEIVTKAATLTDANQAAALAVNTVTGENDEALLPTCQE